MTAHAAALRRYPAEAQWVCQPCRRLYLASPQGCVWAWVTVVEAVPELNRL